MLTSLAVVPPSTKHLTDEELKQQYGIHMTSRIEADGESKEAKWADIDDDEDDWAPDTIEWADGTKMTLNNTNNLPGAPENMGPPENNDKPGEQSGAVSQHPMMSSIGPNATVLKVGASVERQQAHKGSGLQKGPMEAMSATSMKSPAPVPAKSPWAALPPVDKSAPIAINPQPYASPQNQFHQMNYGGPQSHPANFGPPSAQEISADDFSRSWRDSQPDQPRELFMPNSGRYEAVNDSRRRGSRNDQNFRAPAVLQRPPTNDARLASDTPASFHSGRPSNDQSMWNRRRASSIHSGGSGSLAQTMSGVSMPSQPSPSFKHPAQFAPNDGSGPVRGVHVQPGSAMPQHPQPGMVAGVGPSPEKSEEEHKRAIERGRQNIQQRQEEEKREEAAKRERIRLKMAQLELPVPEKPKSEGKTEGVTKSDEPISNTVSSPPKPPVTEMHGQPKQYGMMKVYHPDTVRRVSPPTVRPDHSPSRKIQEAAQQPPDLASRPVINGTAPVEGGNKASVAPMEQKTFSNDPNAQPWNHKTNAPDNVSGWNGGNQQTPPMEGLWGPLSHDKGLGNGTFDQRLPRLTGKEHQQSWLQGRNLGSDGPHPVSPMRPLPAEPVKPTQPGQSYSSPEQRPMAANSEIDSFQPAAKMRPIGPPQPRASNPRWQQSAPARPPPTRPVNAQVSAWNNFHVVAAQEDKADKERHDKEYAARREEEARTGIRQVPQYNIIETWKQIEVGDKMGDRRIASVVKTGAKPASPSPAPYVAGSAVGNDLPVRAGGSRFFGAETRRAVTYGQPEIAPSPSPPPAEEFEGLHPAFDGDKAKPVINLPQPKAVVNLPKPVPKESATTSPSPPRTFAAAVAAQAPTNQPAQRAVSTPMNVANWQNRIDDLLGKKSPPKKTIAVASASREPLEVMPASISAAVSLPLAIVQLDGYDDSITTKDVEEEEDLFEDRDLGSMPSIRVPQVIPGQILQPHPAPHHQHKHPVPKREMQTVFGSVFDSGDDPNSRIHRTRDIHFFIHLPDGASHSKILRKATNSTHHKSGFVNKGARHPGYNPKHHRKGHPKSRDSSASFTSSQHGQNQGHQHNRSGHSNPSSSANGAVPSPRAGFAHNASNQGWRPNQLASAGAGVAH